MLYRPRLSNGKWAPLSWPIVIYRLTNIICWPLEDNVSWFAYGLDRFCWFLAFLVFIATNDAEMRYLRSNINNLDELLTGIPTYFVLIEINIRAFSLGVKKENFKRLLQKFYAEFYIEKSSNDKIYKSIQRHNRPILAFSVFYLFTLITYTMIFPIYLLSTGSHEFLYKMLPPFDTDPWPIYLTIIFTNIWIGFIVATMMFGEANVLSQLIFHLNGRYVIMRDNLNANVDKILESKENDDIVENFRQLLVATINENVKLNSFAEDIQREFSFRIFIIFSFIAASLCALGFKVYTSPMTSIGYIFWTMGKIQETIAYGQMGSTIINTTNGLSSMYYESKWELILQRSSDAKANVHIMKLINLAIGINRKPFSLTGLNFFQVSLPTAVTKFITRRRDNIVMLYLPRLANGKPVTLSWPFALYRYINVIVWPLEDNVSRWGQSLSLLIYIGTALICLTHWDAELRFLHLNVRNLDEFLAGIPTYFVLVETNIRSFTAGLYKEKFKKFLKIFFSQIYIEKSENPEIFQTIQRQYRPVLALSVLYLCALSCFLLSSIYSLAMGQREIPYKMTLPYDITPIYVYVPVLASNFWVGIIVTATILGEAYSLGVFVFNLTGRYQLMRQTLNEKVELLLKYESSEQIAATFNQVMSQTLKENLRLNQFAQEIQKEFSFRIFIIFSFIAATLCALGFKVYTSPATSIPFIFWSFAKVQETIALGELGSTLITATDGLSSMYYESKWESIIAQSSNTEANVALMKTVNLAMLTNKKSFSLTGLNFFSVSLTSAVAILQGAGSYFTCLTSLR